MLEAIHSGIGNAFFTVSQFRKKTDFIQDKRLEELKASIDRTCSEINCALENFNNVTEPKLIDFYIYKIQSEQTRYDQLLCEYKQLSAR